MAFKIAYFCVDNTYQDGHDMMKRLFLLFALLTLLAPAAVHAQTPDALDNVEIDLWPEYDRAGVLVIYRLTLSPQTSLPANLSIRIPTAAGDPFAVAGRQADGSLFTIPSTREVSGIWASINFTADVAELQIEYYDPALKIDGQHRQFDFVWPGDYATGNLSIQIQQPFDASAMLISPSFGAGIRGGDGLTYFNREVGQLNAGQTIEISLEYDKTSDSFSAQNMTVQPAGETTEVESGSFQIPQIAVLVIAIVMGAALIVVGVVWYLRSGKQSKARTPRRRHTPAADRPAQPTAPDGHDIYCHNCGKRAQAGDRFCRSCGTPLRMD
jgi:hypothetical protein